MSKETSNDKLVDSYLEGQSELSGIYQGADKHVVPDMLSARIKKMARDEQERQNKKHNRWAIPLSLAAAITLSVSLYLSNQPEQAKQPVSDVAEVTKPAVVEEKTEIVQVTPLAPESSEVPSHISDMLQSTGKRANEDYPQAEELKSWSLKKWATKIQQLQEAGEKELASRYRKDFKKFHPRQDIDKLIEELN